MRPPDPSDVPRSHTRLTLWLDRQASPESRTYRYLDLARSITQVLAVAGLLALVVQLREANNAARRDAYNHSVDASLLIDQVELDSPDLACILLPKGPARQLDLSELRAVRYLELNLDLHERLWRQHQEGVFGDEAWEPWDRWFRDAVVTSEMFPAVWTWERDYYQDNFVRYVDEIVANEVTHRTAATVAAGGTPSPPQLAAAANLTPPAPPACQG
jgi:hypothetical protein